MSRNHPTKIFVEKLKNNKFRIIVVYNFKFYETIITNEEFGSQFIDIERLEEISEKKILISDMKFEFTYKLETMPKCALNVYIDISLKKKYLKEVTDIQK